MRRKRRIAILLLVCFLICSCGKSGNSNPDGPEQAPTEEASSDEAQDKGEASAEVSDTASANGYTIKIVAVHKTKDSNGEPIAAMEFLFTNENAAPVSFMSVAQATAFQNGIELRKDEMFLEKDYDWDSFYTEIKDGATIPVFHAIPLQNENDPVEVTVDLIDQNTNKKAASAAARFELSSADATLEKEDGEETASETSEAQEDMDELSKLGDVEVENGVLTVSVTLPAEYAEGVTQEQLDANKGTSYQSAVLNEDGSVTYKMTKQQHKEMLKGLSESFDESINQMIDDENYSITGITHNDDFTEFDVTLEGTEVGFNDSFSAISFYMYGGIYGIFNGSDTEHVIVNFHDPDGNLIESYDSANMES